MATPVPPMTDMLGLQMQFQSGIAEFVQMTSQSEEAGIAA
jgi:hypothetical protein